MAGAYQHSHLAGRGRCNSPTAGAQRRPRAAWSGRNYCRGSGVRKMNSRYGTLISQPSDVRILNGTNFPSGRLRRSSTLTRATKLRLFRRSNAFAPNPQGRQSARWAFDPRPLSSPVRNGRLHLTVKTSGAAPKRIIQIAPIIHTIGHLLLRLCSGAGVRTICTSLEVATGLADREVNATSSTSSPGYKECILASRIFHHPFEYHRR